MRSLIQKKECTYIIVLCLLLFPVLCSANTFLKSNPTTWRIENAIANNLVMSYTGSTCAGGRLDLAPTATDNDKNRFWATVLAAKMSAKDVFVYYDDVSNPGVCYVTSFGIDKQ